MPYYVKVTKKVREAILPAYLVVQKTFDGNYLLFQSALEKVEGNTLSERCERIGGALLTPLEAKAEIKGASCLPCHTPKEYGGEDTEENTAPGIDTGIGAGSESTDAGTEEPDSPSGAGDSETSEGDLETGTEGADTAKDAEIVTNKEREATDE